MPIMSTHTLAQRASIGEGEVWIVAGGAGHGVVFGQPRVVEELAAQGNGFRGGRVVWRG